MFTTTTWIDKQAADKFYKSNFEDNGNNAVGLFSSNVLYYTEGDKEGTEINIPNTFNVPMGKKQLVEEPIFEKKDISKEVPYTSFDEEGNELTLYRTVTCLSIQIVQQVKLCLPPRHGLINKQQINFTKVISKTTETML